MKTYGMALITVFSVCLVVPVYAGVLEQPLRTYDSKLVNWGHNLGQTAEIFPKGRCTLGFVVIACGVSDRLTLGISPWLETTYKMHNLVSRYRIGKPEGDKKYAVQFSYFKTYGKESFTTDETGYVIGYRPNYEMEAAWFNVSQTFNVNSSYRNHLSLFVNYYSNDKKPFSLRRPQVSYSPWQYAASNIFEMLATEHFRVQAEVGALGITDKYPAIHMGASLNWSLGHWLMRFGSTSTGPLSAWWSRKERADYQASLLETSAGYRQVHLEDDVKFDFSVHPEITLQYFFDL